VLRNSPAIFARPATTADSIIAGDRISGSGENLRSLTW